MTKSNLAALTAEVMGTKQKAARALTPVEGEAAPLALPRTQAPFPNDMPQEVVTQKVGELSAIIDHLVQARDAMAALVNAPVGPPPVDEKARQKAAEREADFAAEFRAKQEAAQKAVYDDDADAKGEPPESPAEGNLVGEAWTCPEHGRNAMKETKAGRSYVGCPNCNQFKR